VAAVDLLHEGKFGNMVCMREGIITAIPMEKALKEQKPMDTELCELSKLFY